MGYVGSPFISPVTGRRLPVSGGSAVLPAFSPTSLFTGGFQGVWFDFSDMSTLFQDSARTTPVTAAGQPIGGVLDKSGNGNHLGQATAAFRPTWNLLPNGKMGAQFDGSNDYIQSLASIDLTGTNKFSGFCGLRKTSDAATAIAWELSVNSGSTNGTGALIAPSGAAANFTARSRGTTTAEASYTNAAVAAPVSAVATVLGDISAPSSILRVNAVQQAITTTTQGTGNLGNNIIQLGRAAAVFTGFITELIVVGKAVSTTERDNAEAFVNTYTGAY